MNKALRPLWGIFLILVAVTAVALLARSMRPDEIIPWRPSYDAARAESARTNKPILAYFTAGWCAPCQEMKHTTWADKNVDAALRDFVPVKIDIDREQDLARKFAVRAVPAYAVVRESVDVVKQAEGAMEPAEFVAWLKK